MSSLRAHKGVTISSSSHRFCFPIGSLRERAHQGHWRGERNAQYLISLVCLSCSCTALFVQFRMTSIYVVWLEHYSWWLLHASPMKTVGWSFDTAKKKKNFFEFRDLRKKIKFDIRNSLESKHSIIFFLYRSVWRSLINPTKERTDAQVDDAIISRCSLLLRLHRISGGKKPH